MVTLPRIKGESGRDRERRIADEKMSAQLRLCNFCPPLDGPTVDYTDAVAMVVADISDREDERMTVSTEQGADSTAPSRGGRTRSPLRKLSDEQELELTRLYSESEVPVPDIASRFGVGESSVYRISQRHGAKLRGTRGAGESGASGGSSSSGATDSGDSGSTGRRGRGRRASGATQPAARGRRRQAAGAAATDTSSSSTTSTPGATGGRRRGAGASSGATTGARRGRRPAASSGGATATGARRGRAAASAASSTATGARRGRGAAASGGAAGRRAAIGRAGRGAGAGRTGRAGGASATSASSGRFRVGFVGEAVVEARTMQEAIAKAEAMGATDITSVARVE
jgi:hypothetical protein